MTTLGGLCRCSGRKVKRMLKMVKMERGAVKAAADYFIKKAKIQGRYYITNEELSSEPAHWGGSAAEKLGLIGKEPTVDDFVSLMMGEDPRTEKALLPETAQGHQPGLEMVVSIPKGWSAAWAAAPDSDKMEMERILRRATERLVEVIERDVPLIRRGRDGDKNRILEKAAGIVVGYFPHMTSRGTLANLDKGIPPDFQAHYHLIVPNLALAQDGTWKAINSYSITLRQSELDCQWQAFVMEEMELAGMNTISQAQHEHELKMALYNKHVAQLERAGVKPEGLEEFERYHKERTGRDLVSRSTNKEFFLRGFSDRKMIKAFSSRHEQIEGHIQEALLQDGHMTKEQLTELSEEEAAFWTDEQLAELSATETANLQIRVSKLERLKKMPLPFDTVEKWQSRLRDEFKITVATFRALFQPEERPEVTRQMVLDDAMLQLPEKNSMVSWDAFRGLVSHSALRLGYAAGLDELRQDLIKVESGEMTAGQIHPDMVVRKLGDREHVTSQAWLLTEKRILMEVRRLRDAKLPAPTIGVNAEKVAAALATVTGKPIILRGPDGELNEQGKVLNTVLTRRVGGAVEGEAGSGKGVVARVWAAAWKQAEPESEIYALAVSGKRAIKFAGEVGASKGMTFEKFARDVARGKIDPATLTKGAICVDEGAMANSSRLALVLDAVAKSKATPGLLLVGDPKQMKGISASGLFQEVSEITGKLQTISEVQRVDRTWDKRDVFISAQKNIRSGDPKKMEEALDYHIEEGHLKFVNSPEEARAMTVAYWAESYKPEHHGSADHPVIAGDRQNWEIDTLSTACQNMRLERGDLDKSTFVVASFDDPTKDYERRQRIFAGTTKLTVDEEGKEHKTTIPGDLVRITDTIWCREIGGDGKRKEIRNGDQAEVAKIVLGTDEQPAAVQLRVFKDKKPIIVSIERQQDWDKLRLGYAVYTMGDQGETRNQHAALLGQQTTRASFYVTDTRSTRPGLLVADKQSLGVEKDATEEDCKQALLVKLTHDDDQIAALNLLPQYVEFREREAALMAERQIELDAEREAALQAETEEDREEEERREREEEDRRHREEMDEDRQMSAA